MPKRVSPEHSHLPTTVRRCEPLDVATTGTLTRSVTFSRSFPVIPQGKLRKLGSKFEVVGKTIAPEDEINDADVEDMKAVTRPSCLPRPHH